MGTNITVDDFHTICRVCMQFSDIILPISLYKIIDMMSVSLDDNLPKQLCENCYSELQNCFQFQKRAKKSDLCLKRIVENSTIISNCDNTEDNLKIKTENFELSLKNEPTYDNSDSEYSYLSNVIEPKIDVKNDEDNSEDCLHNDVSSEKKQICQECDFTSDHIHHLELHMKRFHQKKGESCSKCNKKFYLPILLEKHEQNMYCNKSKFCDICCTNFKTSSNFLRHSIDVHGIDRPYKCGQCSKSFKLHNALKLHERSRHSNTKDIIRVPCDICGKPVLKGEIKRHLKIHKNDRDMIQCSQCDKKFLHHCSLKIHIQRFHENKPREYKHLCTVCGKKFGTKNDLERHGSVHRTDRPFNCPQCGKGFKLNHNLKSHIKQIHLKMKVDNRIPCKVCGKMISKTNMKPHLLTHKPVRDVYSCTQCSKQFLHQLSLEQHIQKLHEKIVRELRHLCNMCGKGFNTRTELKIHMLSHSDEKTFACQTCGMKYKTMHGLRYHTKSVHLNLKPHPCPICSRHFSTRGVVERHMRTHTGERPFSCTLCEKSFNQKSTLTTHLRLVHSI